MGFFKREVSRRSTNPLLSCEQRPECILKRGATVNSGSVKQNNPQTWHENMEDAYIINIPMTFRGHDNRLATGNSK